MEDYIFSQTINKPEINEEYYTLIGMEDFLDTNRLPRQKNANDNTFAKKITRDDGSIRYSIKLNTNGKLHNPIAIYQDNKNQTFLDRICRSSDKFRNVSYKVFDLYTNFLKTKNIAWLNNAEREAS